MKRIIISMVAALTIATTSQANSCVTPNDRIGFGVIGAVQGAIIGGPLGFIWAVGAMKYAEIYENKLDCSQENLAQKFEQAKIKSEEKTITLIQQTTKVDNKLDVIEKNKNINNDLITEKSPSNKVVIYDSFVTFGYDSYTIRTVPSKFELISKDNLESITINGHTDKRGTNEYNFALGLKRAKEVKQLFIDNDFNPDKIKTVSFGESSPISNDDSLNRRVDLKIQYK